MKIESIYLKDFKRFKDLTVSELPESANLVVLVGPNGCGKSSVFDAIHRKAKYEATRTASNTDGSYYDRIPKRSDFRHVIDGVHLTFHVAQPKNRTSWRKAVYVRSAYRNDPSFSIDQLQKVSPALEEERIQKMIDNDQATSLNYRRLVSQALENLFEEGKNDTTLEVFRDEILADIREAVRDIFPTLELNSLGNPLAGHATFRFNKGEVKKFAYENLSGGEKAAFDLILDLVVKRREYDDTVFCIDEPEAHIGMKIQQQLLSILYTIIPDNCQLWIATHSIGMMREAYNLQRKEPEKVVFLDFDNLDFDKPQKIKPARMNRALWVRMHSVALDDLADLILPGTLIICESCPERSFDAQCYNNIFASENPDVLFVSAGGKSQLKGFATIFRNTSKGATVLTLRDRDHLTGDGRKERITKNNKVLSRKNIEEYLLDEKVLEKLCTEKGNPDAINILQAARHKHTNAKPSVNDVRNAANREFCQNPVGDNTDDFLINTMSRLITPEMKVYKTLEADIFGDKVL